MSTTDLKPSIRNGEPSYSSDYEFPVFSRRSLSPVSPWQWLERVQDEVNALWQRLEVQPALANQGLMPEGAWTPNVDVREGLKHWTIEVDLPGVSKDDVSVELSGRSILIRAEMKKVGEAKGEKYYRHERRYGKFARLLPLPDDFDDAHLSCRFENGVLTCHLPKSEKAAAAKRVIPIAGS